MSDLRPTEKKFEDHIEKHLNSVGYGSTHFNDYDRNLCLIRGRVIDFIKTTRQKNGRVWKRFMRQIQKTKSSPAFHLRSQSVASSMF